MITATNLHRVCTRALLELPDTYYQDGFNVKGVTSFGEFITNDYLDSLHPAYDPENGPGSRSCLLQDGKSCFIVQYDARPMEMGCIVASLDTLGEGSVTNYWRRLLQDAPIPSHEPAVCFQDRVFTDLSQLPWLREIYGNLLGRLSMTQ